jgi:hypothetical protein
MTSQGRARALLHDLVDDVCGRFVASLLYQTPDPHLAVLMCNVETLEFQQYPAGWWQLVVKVGGGGDIGWGWGVRVWVGVATWVGGGDGGGGWPGLGCVLLLPAVCCCLLSPAACCALLPADCC